MSGDNGHIVRPVTENEKSFSTSPSVPGGAGCAIDAKDPRDQGTIRTAIKRWPKRWRGLSDEFKDQISEDLRWARTQAREVIANENLEAAVGIVMSVAKTATLMEGQNQKDDHAEAGVGKGDVTVNVQQNQIIKVEFDRGG